jgi:Flp pilus assembly protein TadD
MNAITYQDFELEISSNGPQSYCGKVLRSPAGETDRCPVIFQFSEPERLKKLRQDLEEAVLGSDARTHPGLSSHAERILRDFGREIFRSVFVNTRPIQELYARSKGAAQDLRIKLRIESPELAGLPWEYLYESSAIPPFVSLRLPVVRYLQTAGAAERMGVKGPLRILGMVANPTAADEWPKLDVVKERNRINKGIDKLQEEGKVVLEWVRGGTAKDLMLALRENEWHVFHFIGHGGVEEPPAEHDAADNEELERGFIVMVDEDGRPAKKFATDLATMLLGARSSLRLVVLNCCESATINVGEKFGNPAIGLMRLGWLPAVVAMQFPISDPAAISMSQGFYKGLASNQPVDEAVTFARRLIQTGSRIEWGIPVLYMRSADGRIFEVEDPVTPSKTAAEAAPVDLNQMKLKRGEFMHASEVIPKTADELVALTRRSQELLDLFKDDRPLAERVAKVYFELGTAQHRNNEISNAAASFAYALKLDPDKPEYRVRRANFNAMVGFHENALVDISEAIKLKPDDAELYWNKGVVCLLAAGPNNLGYIEEAVNAFSSAITKAPHEPKYLAARSKALAQLKRFGAALADVDKAFALAPDDAELMAQRARIAMQASAH